MSKAVQTAEHTSMED